MTAKLIEILEEAKACHTRAMRYFKYYSTENDDAEMKQIYWTRSEEYRGKCEGLLTAYEIITNRCVIDYNISNEIEHLKHKA